jgi:CrcB protein
VNAACYTRVVRLPRDVQLFPHDRRLITGSALLAVALGGMLGSAARWGAGELWPSAADQWSWDLLIVNVVGSLAIGFAARRLVIGTLSADFVITGVLGGFTTFSTFIVVLDDLVDAGRAGLAALYAAVTLVAGITAAGIATWRSGAARGRR